MGLQAILLVLVVCYNLFFYDKVQCSWNLSKEVDFDIEKQLQRLNKPAIKTIMNKYGDIYDCVDFYKQPAFDHPLLRNHTFDFKIKSYELNNKTMEQDPSSVSKSFFGESENGKCPIGSVPIRRIAKDDLVRERHALKSSIMGPTNRPGTYLAIARTRGGQDRYTGAECIIGVNNPKALGPQFSATRIKLQNGPDSIEVGWRVDPTLYGDSQTRFFVRTDVGRSHCFNTRCPGFIHTNHEFPLDYVFPEISKIGGPSYDFLVQIVRDNLNEDWNLIVGEDKLYIGYWPAKIFTGMKTYANYIEWGAAAYSPPGSPLPQMGSGNFPIGSTNYDAYIGRLGIVNEKMETMVADNIDTYANDSSLYSVRDIGSHHGRRWGRMILYGGPGKR